MQTTRRFAYTLGLTCLFASPFALGCISPSVIGGNEGGAGGAGVAVAVVSTGISPNTAIAVTRADQASHRVTISNFGQACPQETPVPSCPDQTLASFTFDFPVGATAGDVVAVSGLNVVAGQEDGSCWGGGGSAFASVEVLAADAASLTLRLTDLAGAIDVNLEGTYNVPICGGAPLTNALALYRADLGGPGTGTSVVGTAVTSSGSGGSAGSGSPTGGGASVGSGSPTGGGASVGSGSPTGGSGAQSGGFTAVTVGAVSAVSSGDGSGAVGTAVTSSGASGVVATAVTSSGSGGGSDDDLFLVISNSQLVCEEPFGGGCDAPSYHVAIALPPAYQQPGYYPLSGIATFSAWAPSQGDCQGGGGSYWDGAIRVLHVGDGEVVFTLEGTGSISGTIDTADGTYAAPLCYGDGSGSSVTAGTGEAVAAVGSGTSSGP